MAAEKARALVVRTTDWSETSRIVTFWSREFGRMRAMAKGGRRLRSNFESALELLTVADVVFLKKTSGGLDLLTEARVVERFPKLRIDLAALYGGYYFAELLSDWTEDYDPHPALFEAVLDALRELGGLGDLTGQRVMAFELTLLHELGYSPALRHCAVCGQEVRGAAAFSAAAGGVVCHACRPQERDARTVSPAVRESLIALQADGDAWRVSRPKAVRSELRNLLGQYVAYRMGKRPRLLHYLTG